MKDCTFEITQNPFKSSQMSSGGSLHKLSKFINRERDVRPCHGQVLEVAYNAAIKCSVNAWQTIIFV